MAAEYNITVRADRDFYLPISVVTAATNPVGLTDYLAVMTVKAHIADSDAQALYKGPPWSSNLGFGQMTFKIGRATNASWFVGSGPVSSSIVYDVAVQDVAMQPNWITLMEGSVTVIGPVTKSIP